MNNRLLIRIAVSLLKARLGQTIVAAIGVMFGIGMFIALVSFMTGLNQMLDNLTITRTPHIRLYKEIRPSREQPVELSPRFRDHANFVRSVKPKDDGRDIRNSRAILRTLAKDSRVYDVAPKVLTPVFLNIGGIETSAVINGIDPVTEEKLFPVGDYLLSGSMNDLATVHNSIIIGKGIAAKLLINPGDRIRVTTAQGDQALLKVVGIIQFGLAEIDDVQSYTSIQTCRNLLGKPTTYVTDLEVKLYDLDLAPAMARQYARVFDVEAMDIQTANAQFETGSNVRSIISYAVGVTLLVVAGFGIYNILNMLIYEKMDAIAILKATGFSGTDVRRIFLFLSMIIGVTGGAAGLTLGYVMSVIISHIPFEATSLPTIKTFPVNFAAVYYFIGTTFALAATYLAGLFPALKAGKIDPVQIIRGK